MIAGALAGDTSIHATAVIYRETGVLILGPSGSGKSALALALMARASAAGAFGALIGDDRIFVRKFDGRLIACGAANMAGVIERRPAGLMVVRHEPAAIMRLAVELCDSGRHGRDCLTLTMACSSATSRLPRLALDCSLSACDKALAVEERLAVLTAANSAR